MKKRTNSTKDWVLVENVEENGLIKLKNNYYIKLIKIIPINFNLKSNIEKSTILESYKNFLKSCDFDIQIIIQSKKERLSKNIINIQNNDEKENKRRNVNEESSKLVTEYTQEENSRNKKIINLCKKYINNIEYINSEKNLCSKNYFILSKYSKEQVQDNNKLIENQIKIKEGLIKCGNVVVDNLTKDEIEEILNSFFNPK